MQAFSFTIRRLRKLVAGAFLLSVLTGPLPGQPEAGANAAFDVYARAVEARLAVQHRSPAAFLAGVVTEPKDRELRSGQMRIEQINPAPERAMQGALVHHWRGTAFAPGATVADFDRLLGDVKDYPKIFAPEVVMARVLGSDGRGQFRMLMRVRQRHVLTVVLDTTYQVEFGLLDGKHGYSLSRSVRVQDRRTGNLRRTWLDAYRRARVPVAAEHLLEL